jgi:hypothetical protein
MAKAKTIPTLATLAAEPAAPKKRRPSKAKRTRATRRRLAEENPKLLDVGDRVRVIADKGQVGVIREVLAGERVPVLLVQMARDGYEVRYNYDQVEPDA